MEEKRDLEGKTLLRDFTGLLESRNLNEEERTIEFPFSSETPVDRGYLGKEVLDHREGSIDFSRLNAAAPLLFNHNVDVVLGVVERGWLDKGKKRGMAKVRFASNQAGQEAFDLVKEGVYRNVSFGYSCDKTKELGDGSYLVERFTPAELSLVSCPADFSVGISRAKEDQSVVKTVTNTQQQPTISDNERATAPSEAASVASPPTSTSKMTESLDLDQVRSKAASEAQKEERSRIANITALCRKHNFEELGVQLVENGSSIDDARAAVLDTIGKKPVETVAPVELNQKEQSEYSITAGIRAALTGDWSSKEAGFVRELSQEVERSGVKRTTEKGFLVPYAALQKRATYVTSGPTTGGNLVETELKAEDFIESLRNNTLMLQMGVTTMPGLTGNIDIPRRSGNSTGYWLANETTAITQSESVFDQIQLSPKNFGVLSKYSRQTLLQATPGIEQLIRSDLSRTVSLGVDLAILNGTGSSGQPTGILQTSGIGSVSGGTNGAAITLENLINLEEEVLNDNAGADSMGYVTNSKTLSELKKLRAGGSATGDGAFLWNTDLQARGRGSTPGVINGYNIGITNQVPSNLTKGSASGVCSAVLFGDFSQCTVGFWGNGMEMALSDSDASDFTKALTAIRAITTLDVAVRQPSGFSAILDVLT